jgi:N-acetylglucosamine kinase-like BadF-type ATPase
MEVALEAAVGAGRGVVLIAGTGSIAYGRNDLGQQARAGGHGLRFSDGRKIEVDEGSGFDIGLRAVRAVRNPLLFWRRRTPLARKMKETFGFNVRLLKGAEAAVEVSALVPVVVEAARENDARARRILEEAAEAVARLGLEVLRQLDLLGTEVLVAASGGVFKESPEVFARVQGEIQKAAPKARVEMLAVSPAEGAARLAQRLWLQEQGKASA